MAEQAKRDQNHVTTMLFVGSDGGTYNAQGDENTGRLKVDSASGSGTVTSVSVVSGNGFAGSVATATTTPAITLSTTINAPVLAGNGTAISAATTTGSGSTVVLATSPTLVTPNLGTPSTLVGTNITGTAAGLTAGTASAVAVGGITGLGAGVATFLAIPSSANLISAVTDETGSGALVFANTPTLVTPVLGVATATSVNGLTLTSSTGVLTITNAKTLAVTNTLTLSGTDSTVMTFPSTTATIARTDAAQTFTGLQTYSNGVNYTNNAIAASGNAATVPITARIHTVTNNSAATLTITLTTTSAVDGQLQIIRVLDFSAAAQTITWVNTENSTVTAPATSNGSTTLPLTAGFQYNAATSKWRCIATA